VITRLTAPSPTGGSSGEPFDLSRPAPQRQEVAAKDTGRMRNLSASSEATNSDLEVIDVVQVKDKFLLLKW
jgi:hypothetical protein